MSLDTGTREGAGRGNEALRNEPAAEARSIHESPERELASKIQHLHEQLAGAKASLSGSRETLAVLRNDLKEAREKDPNADTSDEERQITDYQNVIAEAFAQVQTLEAKLQQLNKPVGSKIDALGSMLDAAHREKNEPEIARLEKTLQAYYDAEPIEAALETSQKKVGEIETSIQTEINTCVEGIQNEPFKHFVQQELAAYRKRGATLEEQVGLLGTPPVAHYYSPEEMALKARNQQVGQEIRNFNAASDPLLQARLDADTRQYGPMPDQYENQKAYMEWYQRRKGLEDQLKASLQTEQTQTAQQMQAVNARVLDSTEYRHDADRITKTQGKLNELFLQRRITLAETARLKTALKTALDG